MCIKDQEFANDFKNGLYAIYGILSKTVLFWVIMQWVVVIPYRCFGTTYWSHLLEDGTISLSSNVSKDVLKSI